MAACLRENPHVRDTIPALFRTESIQLSKRLGEWLIEQGKLSTLDLERALDLQQDEVGEHERIGALLLKLGVVSARDVAEALAAQLGLALVEPADYPLVP